MYVFEYLLTPMKVGVILKNASFVQHTCEKLVLLLALATWQRKTRKAHQELMTWEILDYPNGNKT
jgi:hypothetical protein